MLLLTRLLRSAAAAGLALLAPWVQAQSAVDAATPAVPALIVRLQDAPGHVSMREHALAAQHAQRTQHRLRWQALLADTGLSQVAGLRLEPVGRASLRVRPGRAWSAEEAARWQARLQSRPEVAWVVADTREALLQADTVTPDDPLFAGTPGQWWLQPVSGSNANAIEARRRGVPGVQTAWPQGMGSAATVIAVLDSGWTAHPDLDPNRLLPGYDMVSDWDDVKRLGAANDGDGRDADAHDPGDGLTAADQAADPSRYAGCEIGPSRWHGTAVAGLIAAHSNNAEGVAGIDGAAQLLPVRVAGRCGASVRDIVDGLRWAAGLAVCRRYKETSDPEAGCAEWAPVNAHPARVVNLSYGGAAECNAEYQDAIDELWSRGTVVVAAAGNTHGAPTRPANCRHVIGVAALNRDGFKTNYSNFGAALRIATVGGDDAGGRWGSLLADSGLVTLTNLGTDAPGNPGYAARFGTSFAAPLVTGTLGLMLAQHPGLSAQELVDGLADSARPHVQSRLMAACSAANPGRCACSNATCGAGILDTPQAVAYAQALAAGHAYQTPNQPTVQIDTAELREAVALGPDRESAAGQAQLPATADPGSGGGALQPIAALALALAATLLRRRREPAQGLN